MIKKYLLLLMLIVVVALGGVLLFKTGEETLGKAIDQVEEDLLAFQADLAVWNDLYLAADDASDGIVAGSEELSAELNNFSQELGGYSAELQALDQAQLE